MNISTNVFGSDGLGPASLNVHDKKELKKMK